jgi:carbon starvation protein CstA
MSPNLNKGINHLLLEVSESFGLRISPRVEVIVSSRSRCVLLFLFGLLLWNCSITFQEAPFSVREIFLPINRCVVYGTWDKFVQIGLNFREILGISFVLFAIIRLQEVSSLHFWRVVRINAKRLNP